MVPSRYSTAMTAQWHRPDPLRGTKRLPGRSVHGGGKYTVHGIWALTTWLHETLYTVRWGGVARGLLLPHRDRINAG